MDLTKLTDAELLTRAKKSAGSERYATANLIQDLAEIERRLLYAKYGCDSLFRFCVKMLKMSEPQAARRVNATRLFHAIPQLKTKIESGEVPLTTASQLQSFCWREKRAGHEISNHKKMELLLIALALVALGMITWFIWAGWLFEGRRKQRGLGDLTDGCVRPPNVGV